MLLSNIYAVNNTTLGSNNANGEKWEIKKEKEKNP